VTGNTDSGVLAGLCEYDDPPDLIISDYHLRGGDSGVEVIRRLRSVLTTPIPAFLMSGDTGPDPLREAHANGYSLLHKPVDPVLLRTMLTQVLKRRPVIHAHQDLGS
jgi:CheY-like chemotaxis protein